MNGGFVRHGRLRIPHTKTIDAAQKLYDIAR
jgi:hypothetical protein